MTYLRGLFRNLSIKYKIALIVLVTSGAALMIAGASLVTFDVRSYKSALVSDLSVKADIIAANSTAALAFEDCRERRLVTGAGAAALERRDPFSGETPLLTEVQLGEHEHVERLLQAGADANAATAGTPPPLCLQPARAPGHARRPARAHRAC